MERIEKEREHIRNDWFKDHVATVAEHEGVTILDWKKPGTNMYAVKYVMVGNKLFISGDIGSAVYDLTWNATPESFDTVNLSYFTGKLSCSSRERWNFDDKKAIEQIDEWLEETLHDIGGDEDDEEVEKAREIHEELIYAVGEWSHVQGYQQEVWRVYQSYSHTDGEEFEHISKFGRELPNEFIAYLLGIQMASEQLKMKVVEKCLTASF